MKTFVSIAVTAALSVGAAHAALVVPGANQGELIEFVVDNTNGDVYARGIQVSETSVLPASAIESQATYASATPPVSTGYTLPTITADSNLTTFLNQDGGKDSFSFGLLGAGQNTGGASGQNPGASVVEFTSPGTVAASTLIPPQGSALSLILNNMAGDYVTINGIIKGTAGDGTSADVSGQFSSASPFTLLYGQSQPTLTALGTSENLYAYTNDGKNQQAQLYTAGLVTMTANGTLEAAGGSPVPLPAAVWLLGSGLVGLAGVGRRRKVKV